MNSTIYSGWFVGQDSLEYESDQLQQLAVPWAFGQFCAVHVVDAQGQIDPTSLGVGMVLLEQLAPHRHRAVVTLGAAAQERIVLGYHLRVTVIWLADDTPGLLCFQESYHYTHSVLGALHINFEVPPRRQLAVSHVQGHNMMLVSSEIPPAVFHQGLDLAADYTGLNFVIGQPFLATVRLTGYENAFVDMVVVEMDMEEPRLEFELSLGTTFSQALSPAAIEARDAILEPESLFRVMYSSRYGILEISFFPYVA